MPANRTRTTSRGRAAGDFDRSRPRFELDRLEPRQLLAVISGVVYGDLDNNEVRGFFENGIPDVNVFIDANENGAFDEGEPQQLTDSQGRYRFRGLTAGTYYVGVELPEGYGQTSPGLSGKVPTGFNIDVVFPDNSLTPLQQDVFETASQKWESVIVGDLPDVPLPDGDVIDDIRITATGPAIDGPGGVLGRATFTEQRSTADGGLPYEGFMEFDAADLNALLADQQLDETILHEMGHVLGIGTLWTGRGDTPVLVTGVGGPNPQYLGEQANMESQRLLRNSANVVIETDGGGGTAYSHWDDDVYGNELMTGYLSPGENPLSRLTAAGLEDIGYEINYLGVDEYRGIGALDEDLDKAFTDIARIPFEVGLTLNDGEASDGSVNFGIRPNSAPNPFFFNVGPVIQQVGEPVVLLTEIDNTQDEEFTGDADFRDRVVQMNFYRESNGVPGLQAGGEEGDELIEEVLEADIEGFGSDSYAIEYDTTGLDLGEQTFYARAFDRLYYTRDRITTLNLVDDQTLPEKPTDLQALGQDTETILATWLDNSTDESGFLLEVSRSAEFDVPSDIQRYYLPPGEGTGPQSFEYHALEGAASTRYFRVRAFNTAGSTPFAGRAEARTLSVGEILVDNSNEEAVTNDGFTEVVDPGRSVGLSYLRGTSGSVDFNPLLDELHEYFVFLKNVDISTAGSVVVQIFSDNNGVETMLDEVEVDQDAAAGADVLVGSYQLGEGSFVRVAHDSGVATADAVRFLRTGTNA